MTRPKSVKRSFGPTFVALSYAVFGSAWILLSDTIALWFLADGLSLPLVQTLKGLFYVVLTSALVYGLVRYSTRLLRAEQTRYREMAENVEDVFYNFDPIHNKLLYAGPPFERIWGRSLEAVYADPKVYFSGIHPDDLSIAHEAGRKQRLGESTESEYRVVTPQGKTTWILDRSRSIRGPQGRVERVVGTMRDITAIKKAQEALSESQRQLTTLLDNLPGAAYRCLLDEAWTTLFISEGITPLTGYQPADFQNNTRITYGDLVHPEDRTKMFREITEAASRGETFEVEYRIITRDGVEKSVWERGRFFKGSEGRPGYLEGFILDVTDRKRAERERQRIEDRYRQSQKLEAIGQLAGGVAHDFNNMLTVILVRAELALRKVRPGDPVHDGLHVIHDAAQRSAALARQLLTYARRQSVTTDVLSLKPIIEAALPMLERLVGENISLKWSCKAELWPVEINPSQVDQLLINLCLNARDAMPQGGLIQLEAHNVSLDEIDCRTRPGLFPGDHIFLSIVDSGTGMDHATIERLFEPFFTTKEVGKGTGLGLSTVHGIVHQAHGFIEVDSSPGKGSVFRILLPRVNRTPEEQISHLAPDNQVRRTFNSDILNAIPSGCGETVLIIDRNTAHRKLAADILIELGYTVLEAGGGETGLKMAGDRIDEVRLILIDELEQSGPLARELDILLPAAARLYMSETNHQNETPYNLARLSVPQTAFPLENRVPQPYIVRKPFATVELALKVREAIANPTQPLPSAS
jgi:two-component system cell cycle sensor histidine kinase/response regulator CckA